jgi:hypothetical protein
MRGGVAADAMKDSSTNFAPSLLFDRQSTVVSLVRFEMTTTQQDYGIVWPILVFTS